MNKPDLVLFVGEALVGNEAVDQLKQFNRALRDYSEGGNEAPIDGILLTKFDTIDDKVYYGNCCGILIISCGDTTGWSSHINDVHNRTANHIHWYWSDV